MVARATFLAPVRTWMQGSCSKFACIPKIVCSLFSIFITFVSDRSFYANRSARARFWLMCAHARSDHAQNLHAVLKLAAFHFIFTWLLSQIAPSKHFSFFLWSLCLPCNSKIVVTMFTWHLPKISRMCLHLAWTNMRDPPLSPPA